MWGKSHGLWELSINKKSRQMQGFKSKAHALMLTVKSTLINNDIISLRIIKVFYGGIEILLIEFIVVLELCDKTYENPLFIAEAPISPSALKAM